MYQESSTKEETYMYMGGCKEERVQDTPYNSKTYALGLSSGAEWLVDITPP
jgi:hypothetical protein